MTHSFGGVANDYPHPDVDFPHFMERINQRNKEETPVFSARKNKLLPWINENNLDKSYNPKYTKCNIM